MEFKPLHELTPEQSAVVQDLYEEAFPAAERVAYSEFVPPSDERVAFAMIDAGEPIGMSVSYMLSSVNWWFLEYFAIANHVRSRGFGSQLWWATLERLDGDCEGIVLEVEAPEAASPGSLERATRERRVRFYLRLGLRTLPVDEFHAPRFDGGGADKFLLLAHTNRTLPSGSNLARLVRSVLVEGYGLDELDALVTRAIDSIAA